MRGRFGNLGIQDGEVVAAHEGEDLAVIGAARMFRGEGYHRIREAERGSVDQPAGVDFRSMVGRAEAGPVHFSINYYSEDRRNGTPIQVNDSRLVMMEGGITEAAWDLRVFGQSSRLNSNFSRILAGRNREIPTSQQMYEYSGVGGLFTARLGGGFLAGADWVRTSWGENGQNRLGGFLQKRLDLGPGLELVPTAASISGRTRARGRASIPGSACATTSPGTRRCAPPPTGASARPRSTSSTAPSGSAMSRVAANDELGEETLYGGEAGFDLYPSAKVLIRGNAFWNSLRNTVGNVTLEVNDEGVFRQRRNIGRANARGLEAEAFLYPDGRTEVFAAYLLSHAAVEDTGLRLPQVPLHQGALGVTWRGPRGGAGRPALHEPAVRGRPERAPDGGLRLSWASGFPIR